MDQGCFRLGTYAVSAPLSLFDSKQPILEFFLGQATDFIGISYEDDERGRYVGVYKEHLNKALDILLTVIGNYTFVNGNFPEKLDHGFYNQSTKQYTGTLGLLHRKQIDMIFPMLVPSHILADGFAATYAIDEGQLTLGTLTKTFKYKKLPIIHNLTAFDAYSWSLIALFSILIFLLYGYIVHFSRRMHRRRRHRKRRLVEFLKKLISTSINFRRHRHFKTTLLLTSLLIIHHVFLVIFPNCLSSNYIVLDKSNLVNSLRDFLDEKTIVLSTTFDGTTVYLKQIKRPFFKELSAKLEDCGIYCLLETLNRHDYQILSNFADRRLSLISTKQIMTIMATTLCWLLHRSELATFPIFEIFKFWIQTI